MITPTRHRQLLNALDVCLRVLGERRGGSYCLIQDMEEVREIFRDVLEPNALPARWDAIANGVKCCALDALELLELSRGRIDRALPENLQALKTAAIEANTDTKHFAENARRQTAFGELATPRAFLELLTLARNPGEDMSNDDPVGTCEECGDNIYEHDLEDRDDVEAVPDEKPLICSECAARNRSETQ